MDALALPVETPRRPAAEVPDLADPHTYAAWRERKLADRAHSVADLLVDIDDPCTLTHAERQALLQRCARWNMAVYRCRDGRADKAAVLALARQLGLHRLDGNWLADDDGLSSIAVRSDLDEPRGAYIPYTSRPIKWHTDGYYHPDARRIQAMVLHCVRAAADGGANTLLDHELAYIALRDASPRWLRALMAPDAMTIPARTDDDGMARAAQSGPVFSFGPGGALHMRYTARSRSIAWKSDVATREAVAFLERFLADNPFALRLKLEPGMGLVANNVLHDRSGFTDDPAAPRLLWRARYLDRVDAPPAGTPATMERPWRSG
ncbi:MAG TPA: TauD/TfdA family dioxygenase [Burkholderiaceae bacterium]|nr:TauD/TfdA family dioxygenase [Burkholderiaceae bacterium]